MPDVSMPRDYDPEVAQRIEQALDALRAAGDNAEQKDRAYDHLDELIFGLSDAQD